MPSFYQLTTIGNVNGQEWIQNLFYRTPDTPTGDVVAQRLILATGYRTGDNGIGFQTKVLLNNVTLITSVICRNITEPADFAVAPSTLAGGFSTEQPASEFLSFKLISNRTRSDIRSTTRSVPVGYENYYGAFGLIDGTRLAALAALAEALVTPISVQDAAENPILLTPITIKREKYDVPNTTRKAYRIPKNLVYLEANHSVISSYSIKPDVTTQNSRKKGRGA